MTAGHAVGKVRLRGLLVLDEQGGRGGRQAGDALGNAGATLDRGQRRAVHQLQGPGPGLAEGHDGRARGRNVGEEEQPGVLERVVGHGAEHRLGDEAQGALGADHEMREDRHRSRVVEERVERVPHGVLHAVLAADTVAQGRVGEDPVSQLEETPGDLRRLGREPRLGVLRRRVDDRAVRQHAEHRRQGAVGVELHPAAHARGVVGENAAHHAGVDRGGVGPDLRPVRGQVPVHGGGDDPRLDAYCRPVVQDLYRAPVARHVHQDPVRDGLPRQAGAGGAEGQRHALSVAQAEELPHLLDRRGLHDRTWHLPVDARVVGEGEPVEDTGQHAFRGENGLQARLETLRTHQVAHQGPPSRSPIHPGGRSYRSSPARAGRRPTPTC